jgi:hypothetical protein
VIWKKVEKEKLESSFNTISLGPLPWSQTSSPVEATLASDSKPSLPGALCATRLSLRLPQIPIPVLEARYYMLSIAPAASGILDMEALFMMQNMRLVEAAKVMEAWMISNVVEEDDETRTKKRITSIHVGLYYEVIP